jgi:hypothetical protein
MQPQELNIGKEEGENGCIRQQDCSYLLNSPPISGIIAFIEL